METPRYHEKYTLIWKRLTINGAPYLLYCNWSSNFITFDCYWKIPFTRHTFPWYNANEDVQWCPIQVFDNRYMFYSEINDLLTELDWDSSGLPIEFLLYDTVDLFGSSDDGRLNPILQRLQKNMVHISNVIRMSPFTSISSFGKRIYRR